MCGILFTCIKDKDKVENAFDLIKYRGPDNTQCVLIDDFYFCHHRLLYNTIKII